MTHWILVEADAEEPDVALAPGTAISIYVAAEVGWQLGRVEVQGLSVESFSGCQAVS